jgi:SynChlorMet cassette protein ScmD
VLKNVDKPIASPYAVLREEFDDWAVLFDPDTGHGFGLNPAGVYLWKLLDGEHSINDMLKALRRDALNVSEEAVQHLFAFVETLTQHGLAAYEGEQVQDYRGRRRPCPACGPEDVPDAMQFIYEPPRLVDLSGDARANGTCYSCSNGSGAASGCTTNGAAAIWGCISYGTSPIHTEHDGADCQPGVYASCDCISYGAYAGGHCSNGTGTYH